MEHSRVALPEYLARIGEIAYTVSSMEWTLLGDLHRRAEDLPATLTLDELEPQTTGTIEARGSRPAVNGMAPGHVHPPDIFYAELTENNTTRGVCGRPPVAERRSASGTPLQ